MSDVIKPSEGFEYYNPAAIFWNSFKYNVAREAKAVSGDPTIAWVGHIARKYGLHPRGLFVSCGNGWVERACYTQGVIKEAYGFDIMPESIAEAKSEAEAIGMPATYSIVDGNNPVIDQYDLDIIVNNGAMHHIACLDKLLRLLRSHMKSDGLYVINDYTGAHRNQYSWRSWSRMLEVHSMLPEKYRVQINYAHMPTMIALDPTEAIHSELQLDITRRYFDIEQEVMIGGGIGYTLMFGNDALLNDQDTDEGRNAIEFIMREDAEMLRADPSTNLFTFAIFRPKETLPPQGILDLWTAEENEREAYAAANGGRYYPPTPLELIYSKMADVEYENRLLKEQASTPSPAPMPPPAPKSRLKRFLSLS